MAEQIRLKDQRVASLEQDAWQPRLAMEVDGPADTKTRVRTEGAAKAVHAMHVDSFSAGRVDPGPKTNSISFGVKAERPALPWTSWSSTALRRPSRISHPRKRARRQPPPAYFPPVKYLQQQGPPSTTQLFGSARPKRRSVTILQFHPPGTTTVSGEINCLLPPLAGGSLRQNPGKIGCSIQAVFKVVFVPTRFWERGARCFVVRLACWSG